MFFHISILCISNNVWISYSLRILFFTISILSDFCSLSFLFFENSYSVIFLFFEFLIFSYSYWFFEDSVLYKLVLSHIPILWAIPILSDSVPVSDTLCVTEPPTHTRVCSVACPLDCVVSDWTTWSECLPDRCRLERNKSKEGKTL